jgi:transcriptional regulator with XRE-family HTH domain
LSRVPFSHMRAAMVTSGGPRHVDSFDRVLHAVRAATGWQLKDLAERFGISTKTIGRYISGQAVPPEARRHGIVHALRDLDPPLLTRVAASLGLSHEFERALPRPAPDAALAKVALDAAAQEVAERLDAGPLRVRAALSGFLSRLAEADLDVRTAQALLAKRGR